ncbi:hypothetical protein PTSG_08920 [Salpingoeca rosetta]|uniref:Glycolipid transfer protein domain-containing protein n=1 Tax=Salpingoeca rosetta (strain ATCC 50818 / BSB-021) TaxID=946362 RepID=F2UL30_SALR5|nr:uncharacterized protein PTSG_08920 [Salpingoeca rosetta]EGD77829.1 hypothetical protein PTSG_08920 [Salpingoeca rosetta]|eukprot:XP_004990305.1 hypothetical protein PTSG_08920 [Salpingoeca rosetta]
MSLHAVVESSRALRKHFDENKSISASLYIRHYRDISGMLSGLGMVFSFVTKDIDSKICILETHLEKRDTETLDDIVLFEVKNKCTNTKKPKSAARTLLRLHRALEFIHHFIERLHALEPSDSAVPAAQEAYRHTLSQYHSWMIRQTVQVALRTLDNKDALLLRVTKTEDRPHKHVEPNAIRMLCEDLRRIWEHVQTMFDEHDLHGLP